MGTYRPEPTSCVYNTLHLYGCNDILLAGIKENIALSLTFSVGGTIQVIN